MIVGLTGGIGAGKSLVARIFELLEVPVYYADEAAKEIITSDTGVVTAIKLAFGADSYLPDGTYNRKYVGSVVFNNTRKLAELDAIVHPPVFKHFADWAAGKLVRHKYVVKEAALLFESGSYRMCDTTVLVTAPLQVRLERLMLRDGLDEANALKRIQSQMGDAEKAALAAYLVTNDEDNSLISQVMALHTGWQGGCHS